MNRSCKSRLVQAAAVLPALLLCVAVTAATDDASRSMGGGSCAKSSYNCVDTPNPLPQAQTVWLEEMTWMDVRDALARGTRTVLIATGGVEPNGPWLALGKHNYVLRSTCEAIARKLGNALCAPIVAFVPQGTMGNKKGHMSSVGTISVEQGTYESLIRDVARSLHVHGFEHIVFISDNGGANQQGLRKVAQELNGEWGKGAVHYIHEYYESWKGADDLLLKRGLTKPDVRDNIHDDPASTVLMMLADPESVRWQARVKADKATIDGVSIADKERALGWGRELLEYRASVTVEAMRKAPAAKP